jgi:hypothetical protein
MIGLVIITLLSMLICYQVAKSRKANIPLWVIAGLLIGPFAIPFVFFASSNEEGNAAAGVRPLPVIVLMAGVGITVMAFYIMSLGANEPAGGGIMVVIGLPVLLLGVVLIIAGVAMLVKKRAG